MDSSTSVERPRKRRAINACISCRSSKVRCDGKRPCERCDKNDTICQYHDVTGKDPNALRIEKLEAEVARLRMQLDNTDPQVPTNPQLESRQPNAGCDFHYLVPIFSESSDVITSVASRSAFLFDAIVSVGCRAEQGLNSPVFRQLQSGLCEHLTYLLITCEQPCLEAIQAITLMAAYSENGYMLIALALRFAIQLGLHKATDQLLTLHHNRDQLRTAERELYRLQRVWHGICNLELFFSLDGGHVPSVSPRTTPRKIRALLNHAECTAVDIRLLSQVELNLIRTDAYSDILRHSGSSLLEDEGLIRAKANDTITELSLWLNEWTDVVSREPAPHQRELALVNLHIQYDWALITLHLKAVSASGIENIAIMTDFQKEMIQRAKEASIRHFRHLLEASTSPTSPSESAPAYLNTFKWTIDYVWAKGAFSVLLVLRLSILLRDPVPHILALLRDAHRVLEELKKVTIGYIPYFQILQTSIEKCEAALVDYSAQQDISDLALAVSGPAESDFQGYAPNQFTFEWDFPGLNLKHMPLGWQDMFVDIDNLF
ncbi:hypothetical protein BU25DRAFT_398596 [Macroventuria anomochaeta]|uniref:Uncharacterized protein n=1 Tax=Macroventuria anomochaeta TaxID=301207 RepID=A0ACB6RSD1_9PLEO|nr:uncharacterized protein BU25DRAFT_398596 [Macroventuria anomochaeta]KAF2624821.1 hypothetical protein BU25DRAFT_398596 [Macroventuria anomochaeta]